LLQLESFTELSVDVTTLAEESASRIFEKADLNSDGKLSFEEFQQWYTETGPRSPSFDLESASNTNIISLDELRQCFSLQSWSCHELCKAAQDFCDANGLMTRSQFAEFIDRLNNGNELNDQRKQFTNLVFQTFSCNTGDKLAFVDLVSALCVLCGGSSLDEKAALAFALFDDVGSGKISFIQVVRLLSNVLKLLYDARTSTPMLSLDSNDLANIVAADIFRAEGLSYDSDLSFDQFNSQFSHLVNHSLRFSAHSSFSLAVFTKAMSVLSVVEILPSLAEITDNDGFVSKSHFENIIVSALTLSPHASSMSELEIKVCSSFLFGVMTKHSTLANNVDFADLVSGLVAVGGTFADQNARLLVDLLDVERTGKISKSQVRRAIVTIFTTFFCISS
jgi:Ca2+-binding EF-hand superfamily protein